ncbi:MAG: ATP-binding protein [Pseudomonadota bacterium]|nr:ATP-binding protein [Pseudomonadota bacterium]
MDQCFGTRQAPRFRQDLETAVQRQLFYAFEATVLVQVVVYAALAALAHELGSVLGVAATSGFVVAVLAHLAAWRTQSYTWPLGVLAAVVVGWLTVETLRQGQALPAAAWWLAAIPFILGAAGLRWLAFATLVDFIAVTAWVQFGPAEPPWGLPAETGLHPLRRYIAVVGSEGLALALIAVAMRSRAALSAALDEARLQANGTAELKARFLAHMSHEIRTPLTGILGTAEILDSPHLSEPQRKQLVSLQQQSARSLLALINDALDFAKLEAGKVRLEERTVSMSDIIFEANELFATQAYAKGLELSCSSAPDVPSSFIGDALRLRQIVCNLVGNAVKFTESGGVHIHLSMAAALTGGPVEADARPSVRIDVTDSGPGIPATQLRHLFDAFVQADSSVSRRFGGTGLGLSISHELAELMGGRIEVTSTLGQGSSFALVVPLASPAVAGGPEPGAPADRSDLLFCTAQVGLERHLGSLLRDLRVSARFLDHLPGEQALDRVSTLLIDLPLVNTTAARSWLQAQVAGGKRVVLLTPVGADGLSELPSEVELLYKPVRRLALDDTLARTLRFPGRVPRGGSWPGRPPRDLRALLVEDNPVNQIVVQAMLAELGVASSVASQGREALEMATQARFDVVFMDINMPVMDGLEATRALRELESSRGTERTFVVGMSASCETADMQACSAAGMDAYLHKPFDLLQLRERLESLRPDHRSTHVVPA